MRKPNFFILSLVLLSVLAGCGGQSETETSLAKITVSNNGFSSNSPIYIADAEGYFTEQGLDVEWVVFNRGSESIAALINGDIDVYPGSLSVALLNTVTNEEGIQVVADRGHVSKGTCTYNGIVIGKELYDSGAVTGPADFPNYTVRTPSGSSSSAWLLSLYVAQAGLTLDDLDVANLPTNTVADALASQTIAASTMGEPRLTGLLSSGVAVQVAGMEDFVDDFQMSVMTFGHRLTTEERNLGVRFITGYLKGVSQYNEGKTPRNLEIVSQYTEIPQEELEMACWPAIYDDGHISSDSFEEYQEWAVSIDDLEAVVPEVIYWDPYFVEEAYAILNE